MEIILYYLLRKQKVQYYRYYKVQYIYCFALLVFFSVIINLMEFDTPFFHFVLLVEFIIFSRFFYLVYGIKKTNIKVENELRQRADNGGYLTDDEYQFIRNELKKQSIQLDEADHRIKHIARKINRLL